VVSGAITKAQSQRRDTSIRAGSGLEPLGGWERFGAAMSSIQAPTEEREHELGKRKEVVAWGPQGRKHQVLHPNIQAAAHVVRKERCASDVVRGMVCRNEVVCTRRMAGT